MWTGFLQIALAFFAGAFVYSRGAAHASPLPIPGSEQIRKLYELVRGNGKAEQNKPTLPRVVT